MYLDEPDAMGLGRIDHVAREAEAERLPRTDQPREALGAAPAGDEPEPHLELAEARRGVGYAQVTGDGQFAASAETEAMHGRNDGLGEVGDDLVDPSSIGDGPLLLDGAPGELRDVGSRYERLFSRAVENHDPNRVIIAKRVEDFDQPGP